MNGSLELNRAVCETLVRGTSLIRNSLTLDTYSRTKLKGGRLFLMS